MVRKRKVGGVCVCVSGKTFSKCTRRALEMSTENCNGNTSTSTEGQMRMGTAREVRGRMIIIYVEIGKNEQKS